ncbi:unnamed protein product [Larinioides sclopetarius]|uniref:ATP synthase F0 subunit 8 n=1 Tax=Larinioides sclopetarius TaxID=280406 RepID=A0AAV2BN28_9ARAC
MSSNIFLLAFSVLLIAKPAQPLLLIAFYVPFLRIAVNLRKKSYLKSFAVRTDFTVPAQWKEHNQS